MGDGAFLERPKSIDVFPMLKKHRVGRERPRDHSESPDDIGNSVDIILQIESQFASSGLNCLPDRKVIAKQGAYRVLLFVRV